MRSHLHKVFTKYTFLKKHTQFGASVVVALAFISGVALYSSTSGNIHTSELGFIEISKDPTIVGSIVPASCQSYPTMGSTHGIDGHGGHCSGTCPSGYSVNVRPMFKTCTYYYSSGGQDSQDYYLYLEKYASESCPAYHPSMGYPLTNEDVTTAPVCSKQCPDGSWAFPHLGIYCTALVPTVAGISYSPSYGNVNASYTVTVTGDNDPTYYRYQTVLGAGTACPATPLANQLNSNTYGPTTAAAQGMLVGNTYKTCVQACNASGCSPANGSATYTVTNGGNPTVDIYFSQ